MTSLQKEFVGSKENDSSQGIFDDLLFDWLADYSSNVLHFIFNMNWELLGSERYTFVDPICLVFSKLA